jgi:tRNA (mo5U34)-methyltransferase
MPAGTAIGAAAVREAAASVPLWYHTLELPGGVVTPGWFDLRPVAGRMPWPDVRGKRCLDVGTYDGFLAFELERRGATEVLATDIADHEQWDWPPRLRARGPAALAAIAGPAKGQGFAVAAQALGSRVRREQISVYDLSPERIGTFDVVVCGSLLLHLRDPLRALAAIHSVCAGAFLSAEVIELDLTLLHRRRPVFELDGTSELCTWWRPTAAGHRRMLEASGFDIEGPRVRYAIPLGEGHWQHGHRPTGFDALRRRLLRVGPGIPHQALLAHPARVS